MTTTYPFTAEDAWRDWASPTSVIIENEAVALGVAQVDAGAMVAAAEEYAAKLAVARAPETKGKAATQAKTDALVALREACRPVIGVIVANPNVSDATRVRLGLKPRVQSLTPATVPAMPPMVELVLTGPTSARAFVRNPTDPGRKAKPYGVQAVVVQSYFTDATTGEKPPADMNRWALEPQQGRTTFDLFWPGLASPKAVWVTCHYVTTRNERGPSAEPASVVLPGTGLAAGVATEARQETTAESPMKIAA